MGKSRIVYNKEGSGKRLSRGGPRDIQLRQRILQEEMVRSGGGLAPHIITKDISVPSAPVVDMSQYLPLSEVKSKIEEAVEHTRETVKGKYESGIKSLTEQLNEVRAKLPDISEVAHKQINIKDLKIIELESDIKAKMEYVEKASRDVTDMTIKLENASKLVRERDEETKEVRAAMAKRDVYLHEKDMEIHNKNAELREKEKELHKKDVESVKLKSKAESVDMSEELSTKLDRLYAKIADGSIRHLVGSQMDGPTIADKIFIDPLESTDGKNLDPHIKIEEEKSVEEKDRSVADDTAKLRSLLKRGRGGR